jgi:hypothetical protein
MAVRLSALSTGSPLPPGKFLVLISVRGWVDLRVIVRLEGLGQLEKSNNLIGDRTRDLPACSKVPQTNTLPRVSEFPSYWVINLHLLCYGLYFRAQSNPLWIRHQIINLMVMNSHSWSWDLLEKLPIVQLLENFPAFYGTRRFITAFT